MIFYNKPTLLTAFWLACFRISTRPRDVVEAKELGGHLDYSTTGKKTRKRTKGRRLREVSTNMVPM